MNMEQPMQDVVEDNETQEVEIELLSDNEEKETEKTPVVEEKATTEVEEVSEEHDQEVAEYSDSVKKRIDKLTYKMREAERREQAALKYAEGVKNELTDTKTRLSKVDNNLFSEYNTRVDSQLDRAKANLKQAHEENDTDKLITAQEELAKLSVESESLNRIQKEREEKQIENEAVQLQNQEMQMPPPADPKAQDWAKRNEWFGQDVAMTSSAFAFHRQLVEDERIDPTTDRYYEVLDTKIKEAFPHKFEHANNKPVQAVAGGSVGATTVNKSKKIKLTSSQVAIAKKLGVPLSEYAKHVEPGV